MFKTHGDFDPNRRTKEKYRGLLQEWQADESSRFLTEYTRNFVPKPKPVGRVEPTENVESYMPTTLHDNTYHIDDRDMAERDMDERVARQLPSSKWTRQPSNKSHQNYLNRRPMRLSMPTNQFQLMKTTGTSTNEKIDEYVCDQIEETPRWSDVIIYKDATTQTFRKQTIGKHYIDDVNTVPYSRVTTHTQYNHQPQLKVAGMRYNKPNNKQKIFYL